MPQLEAWTAESVKEKLPDVPVKFNGKVYIGRVLGRKNRFATVSIDDGREWEWNWETIATALNNGWELRAS